MRASFVRFSFGVGLVAVAASPAFAGGADPRCERAKLAAAGRYAECRLAAQAAAQKNGGAPDFFRCDAGLAKAWSSSEAKVTTFCATSGDLDAVREAIAYETDRLALWLEGFAQLGAGRTLATGQTVSFAADRNDGVFGLTRVPDDGALEAGAKRRFVDNGDGTISDLVNGLMWEKKGNDNGLHHVHDKYPWSGDGTQDTIWDWLDDVNAEGEAGFAGYGDWRIPNVRELTTLFDYGREPAIDPIFYQTCDLGCTPFTCSCATGDGHWSATTTPDGSQGFIASVGLGWSVAITKDIPFAVRAVRGGEL
jgi:hypothetical protein